MPRIETTLELAEARRAGFLNIGEAASRSGVSAKMIRHYEAQGLIKNARRTDAGYRLYDAADVHTLQFVRRARRLGFSMKEVAHLLGLWQNRRRSSGDVRRIAQRHISDLEQKIDELQSMKRTLAGLVHRCHGDQRPDCPILEDLAGDGEDLAAGHATRVARQEGSAR
ncbi:MAG: Cu(I)-responsive transcriptional regulator [Vicinamibacterales bacterium]